MASIDGQDGASTERILSELWELVGCSTPSGEHPATEQAIAICRRALPDTARCSRLPCASAGCADDLLATIGGTGTRRLLLLGHLDTVVAHAEHRGCERDGDRVYGSGTIDMKGGVALALALARELAATPESFAEISLLLVCDEEIRLTPFIHAQRFAGYDACLCFEAGERDEDGNEGVIVRRKGAGTLRVEARGRAAHSGANPAAGRNALLALAEVAIELAAYAAPDGPDQLTVVPTVMRAGAVTNVVPALGALTVDIRSQRTAAFAELADRVPPALHEVQLTAVLERSWPALVPGPACTPILADASRRLGAPIVPRSRGGASDASHLATTIPICIDGLGPRGAGAHNPDELLLSSSIAPRLAVARALAQAALAGAGR